MRTPAAAPSFLWLQVGGFQAALHDRVQYTLEADSSPVVALALAAASHLKFFTRRIAEVALHDMAWFERP